MRKAPASFGARYQTGKIYGFIAVYSQMNGFDKTLFDFFNKLAGHSGFLDWLIIFFADYLLYFLIILFIVFLFLEKNRRMRLYFMSLGTISVVLSRGIIVQLIRFFIYRPRPFVDLSFTPLLNHVASSSFPSGHISFLVPLVMTLWFVNKRASIWSLIAILFIGVARIAAGVHWPTDIIMGFVVGLAGFYIAYILLKNHIPSKSKSQVSL